MTVEEFLQGDYEGREGKNWRGLEPEDDVLTTCDKTHVSQRYLRAAEDLVVVRDVLS